MGPTAKDVLTKYALSDRQLTQEDIDKVKVITGYNKTDTNFFNGMIEADSKDADGITNVEYQNLESLRGIYKTAPQLAQKLMIDDTDLGQNKTFQEAWKSWGFDPAASFYLSEAYGKEITPDVKKQFDFWIKKPEYKAFLEKLALDNGFEPVEQQFVETVFEIPEYLNAQLKMPEWQTEFRNYKLDPTRTDYGWNIVDAYINENLVNTDVNIAEVEFLKNALNDPFLARNITQDVMYQGIRLDMAKTSETPMWTHIQKIGNDGYSIFIDEKGNGGWDRAYIDSFPSSEVPGMDQIFTADGDGNFAKWTHGYDFYPGVEWPEAMVYHYVWDKQNANGHAVKMPVFGPDGKKDVGEYIWGDIREEGWIVTGRGWTFLIDYNINSPDFNDFGQQPEIITGLHKSLGLFNTAIDLEISDNSYFNTDEGTFWPTDTEHGYGKIDIKNNKNENPHLYTLPDINDKAKPYAKRAFTEKDIKHLESIYDKWGKLFYSTYYWYSPRSMKLLPPPTPP